jgi:hypothetical protein
VLDGPNANKTGACDGNGYSSITGLVRGGFTARVTATGYTNMERGIGIQADTRQDFALASSTPAPCTCNLHCTCNPVCTCNPHCTCNSQHYWYPN